MSDTVREKVWFENYSGENRAHHYGMSSALGATKEDLPKGNNVPAGSDAFDYTSKKGYFFDGVEWN